MDYRKIVNHLGDNGNKIYLRKELKMFSEIFHKDSVLMLLVY